MIISNSISTKQAAEALCEADNILIICHKNPDGDTIGSGAGLMHALKKLGKTCAVLCNDPIASKYDFMEIELFQQQFIPQYTVAVDVADEKLFGANTLPYSEVVDLCIDHHPSNSSYAKLVCCNGTLPAAAQLVAQVVEDMGVEFDQKIANCLYTGIMTDTGCFKYSATDATTHRVAAKLLDAGAEHTKIANTFFMSRSRKTMELEKYALNSMEFLYDGRCAVIVLTKDILDSVEAQPSDVEGISAIPRSIEGVDVGITIREIGENNFKISVRTSENANACEIAQGLGGGGHTRAAGCEIICGLECAKNAILREVEDALCR